MVFKTSEKFCCMKASFSREPFKAKNKSITESQLPKQQLNFLQLAKKSEKWIVTERYGNASLERPLKKEGLSTLRKKKAGAFDLGNEYGMNTRQALSALSFHMHGISSAMIGIVNVKTCVRPLKTPSVI